MAKEESELEEMATKILQRQMQKIKKKKKSISMNQTMLEATCTIGIRELLEPWNYHTNHRTLISIK